MFNQHPPATWAWILLWLSMFCVAGRWRQYWALIPSAVIIWLAFILPCLLKHYTGSPDTAETVWWIFNVLVAGVTFAALLLQKRKQQQHNV